jgi:hypothetical protein
MFGSVKRIIVVLFLFLLLSAIVTPVSLAWGPAGSDGWYLGPNGQWYQGTPWSSQGYAYGSPNYYPNGYSNYSYPYPGYNQSQYQGYYVPYCAPGPQPYVQVQPAPPPPPPPTYQFEPYNPCQPPIVPDRFHMSWGTFGTYDNWARQFYREHGRSPNDQDVSDFWYSQQYAATHCGHSPWW